MPSDSHRCCHFVSNSTTSKGLAIRAFYLRLLAFPTDAEVRVRLVLVHGAWQGAWAWREVQRRWPDDLERPFALDLPSVSGAGDLTGDAQAVEAFANSLDDDVILVGHSYGGVVVTEAAAGIPRLHGVVYLAALRPETGQSATDVARQTSIRSLMDAAIVREGEQLVLRSDDLASALFGTTDKELVSWALANMHPQPLATFREPTSRDLPSHVASHYVICARDKAIPPTLQESLARRCTSSSRLDASHCPHVEFPDDTARLLILLTSTFASRPN